MSKLFGNLGDDPKMQRQALISRYSAARSNLLLMIIFSLVNILMLATNSGMYFLFSASLPYLLTDLGMTFCGMYPDEYYEGLEGMIFLDKFFFVILLVISLLILVIYLLCWIFSKKNRCGFLIAALALFGIDTVVMIVAYGISSIINLAFHVWVIFILAMGISAHYKLKKLPEDVGFIEGDFTELPADENMVEGEKPTQAPDSVALRPADLEVKARILLECEAYGHTITYRRVKRTNELVIDNNVYGEYTALVEMPHLMTANLGGHSFAAGTDNTSHMIITVDGQVAKTKIRIV